MVKVEVPGRTLEFQPAEVGRRVTLAGANVTAERVPTAQKLSADDTQNDSPAILAMPDASVWTAWIAYRNNATRVVARKFNGKAWSEILPVSEKAGDVYQVKLGRDSNNNIWAVWSEQAAGNFDLYARRFDGLSWLAVERLTNDPQPDIHHALATDSAGNLWLTWQGFRNGKSDIFARRFDGRQWTPAERVSTSPANDWNPAIAADAKGRVYIAWDTYDKGDYDVQVRMFEAGKWGDVMAVASTPKFEAHVSIACDAKNRLWAAWTESGTQWGKDTGFLVKKEGTPLYDWRGIAVAVLEDGKWKEPGSDVNTALPRDLRDHNDLPALEADGAGGVWLFFRHRYSRIKDVPNNTPLHRAAWETFGTRLDGGAWAPPTPIPFSAGRTEMRAAFTNDGRGAVYSAWPTDNRDFEEFLFTRADIHAARIPALKGAEPVLRARAADELKSKAIHKDETADLKRIRSYAIESGGKSYRIYRGDTHRHTEFSMDGNNDGMLMEGYRYAMDAAELDYLGVSEHNGTGGQDVEYINWLLQQRSDVLNAPRTFTPLFVYERSLNYPNGHRNIIFAERGNPTLPASRTETQGVEGAAKLYAYLKQRKGIAISHTSASNMGTDWRDNDPEVEPLVEVYQGDRVSNEYEGAPKAGHAADPGSTPGGFRPAGYIWNALRKGYKLGFQASSDHLSTHISYACTIATDFSRQGLLDAMRQRHSYGATDNIILDYRMDAGGKEYLQGDSLEAAGDFKLKVKAIGTAPVRQIDVITNDRFVHTAQNLEREVNFTYVDPQPAKGESYYYVRVQQIDGQMAWSSPIWVKRP